MKIKNFKTLATTKNRETALYIAEAGLEAVDTKKAIQENVKLSPKELSIKGESFSLDAIQRIFVVGVGKCSVDAGLALEKVLGDRLSGGIVVDVREGSLRTIKAYMGDHPFPSERNIDFTKDIIHFLSDLKESDLVIFIISGGGSTLLCQPKNFTCKEEGEVVQALFRAGADIKKINTVRKHLSLARGGFLAEYAYPARVLSLIFSDVLGDNLEFVASGPTVKDTTTVDDAKKIIAEYRLNEALGVPEIELIETPKDDKYFENVKNILFISNKTALDVMAEKAKSLGFTPKIYTAELSGEASQVGFRIVQDLRAAAPRSVFLYGGETTVTIGNLGKGGRNQELALSALRFMCVKHTLMAFTSDGKDNTDFAGAICDILTKERAEKLNLNIEKYLDENNSYNFFEKVGDYILTGDTGSNVADFVIAINE